MIVCTGELPLAIIRMKAEGIIPGGLIDCGLRGNKGFTLPANIGELGDDITKLDLSHCSLTGQTTPAIPPLIHQNQAATLRLLLTLPVATHLLRPYPPGYP